MVVKQEVAAEITVLGQERIKKEQKSRERLKATEHGVDASGLRAKLIETWHGIH